MSRTKGSKNKPKDQTMPTKTGTDVVQHVPQNKLMLLEFMADKYSLNPDEFSRTVRAVCGMPTATPEQFAAFLLVAKTYDLNPLVKEIYAFPSRAGGIVPIVSVDGWVNLVNSQGQCDGFSFEMKEEGERLISCTCSMYRKDRSHPVTVTEYYAECVRSTDPWKMKHRMLRHKSFIQAARYAFGFSGIYDEDEGQKIAEIDPNKDAGPPRTAAADPKLIEGTTNPPAEPPHDPEEARDGTPPRRAAKPAEPRPDPISSSGPPRDKVSTAKDTGPSAKPIEPFKIPGNGETFESWSQKFIDLIATSTDVSALYKWIDLNSDPLSRLKKGKPSSSSQVDTAIKRTMEALKSEQEKVTAKAAKKAAATSDMDDGPSQARSDANVPQNPEDILAIIEQELAAVEDTDLLQTAWEQVCEPLVEKLDFPPDIDLAQACFDKHSRRLGGE